ncbi:hypothetical protein GMMP1_1400031 [Candidatus Magnetomoraceae bacterium gMMP-1]
MGWQQPLATRLRATKQDILEIVKKVIVAVNRDKVDLWKSDVAKSVDFYNDWFMTFAPKAFRDTRIVKLPSMLHKPFNGLKT